MCDDLSGLDFPFESIPADLLVNPENDILKGFGDQDLDLDCLLNSNLIDDSGVEISGSSDVNTDNTGTVRASNQSAIDSVIEVKNEPMLGTQNQSPVLESLLKSAAVSSPCVNPAPQATNTSFAPTISNRSQCISTSASPVSNGLPNDKEAILAALLRRHEEDRKLLGHLVSDFRRDHIASDNAVLTTAPLQVPTSVTNKSPRQSQPMEQPGVPSVPTQVVVATPVNTRPVGIISGTRMFVAAPSVDSPSPEMVESMDLGDDDGLYDDEPCRPKTKRRSSHNAIEKRYRLSINTRIDELRTLLDGADSKLSKSAVLRRAIEKVRSLERENALLRKELNIRGAITRLPTRTVPTEYKCEISSLDASESSPDPASSPGSSSAGSPPHSPPDQLMNGAGAKAPRLAHLLMKHEPAYTAVASRARICLAGIFLSLLVVNPLALVGFGGKPVSPGGGILHTGRTLLNYVQADPIEQQRHWKLFSFASITVLFFVMLLYVVKRNGSLFKAGTAASGSKEAEDTNAVVERADDVEFLIRRHWRQAEAYIAEGSWPRVVTELKSVLIAMGRPFPISQLDWYRFACKSLVNAVGLGQETSVNVKLDTAALGYMALSKLLSLSMHGYLTLSVGQRVILSLTLWMGMRRTALTRDERSQIFINISLFLPMLRPLLRRRAAEVLQVSESTEVPARLRWILNPEGYRFLVEYKVTSIVQNPIPTSEFDADPSRIDLSEGVFVIAYAFRRKLLEEVLDLIAAKDERRMEEVLSLLTLLIEYSSNAHLLENDKENNLEKDNGMDHAQHWWSNVASVAALWQQERWDKSRVYHSVIDSPPRDIKLSPDLRSKRQTLGQTTISPAVSAVNELAHAVLLAYRVQRRCIFGPSEVPRPCTHNALKMADEAAIILENSVLGQKENDRNHWIMCVLACHWLLTSRLSLNQSSNSGPVDDAQVRKFEQDLSTLQGALKRARLSSSDAFRRWSVMHQARLRLWRGSNPVRTALALRQNSPTPAQSGRGKREESGEDSAEIAHVREWLHQRLMRPRSGMNGMKS